MPWGEKTILMGIVNVTPDSFSDGGSFFDPQRAIDHGLNLLQAGADIIDIGGEASGPGSSFITASEELKRILPVISGLLKAAPKTIISVDSWKAETAKAVLEAGALLINDISGHYGSESMAEVIAQYEAATVIMHNPLLYRSADKITGNFPRFSSADLLPPDLKKELNSLPLEEANILFLQSSIKRALAAGINQESIIIDPGLGFGLSLTENLALINSLPRLNQLGRPILIGASRKRFVRNIMQEKTEIKSQQFTSRQIDNASAAVSFYAILQGAAVIRAHEIAVHKDQALMADYLKETMTEQKTS